MRYSLVNQRGIDLFFMSRSDLIDFLQSHSYLFVSRSFLGSSIHRAVAAPPPLYLKRSSRLCSVKDYIVKHKLFKNEKAV